MTGSQRDLREFLEGVKAEVGDSALKELSTLYEERRVEIEERLQEFKDIWRKGTDDVLFFELSFCLCTPQSSARSCDKAVRELRDRGMFLDASQEAISEVLDAHGVRFPENKARWIAKARERFLSSEPALRAQLQENAGDPFKLRDWLQQEVLGLGLKEASHYARNVGLGEELSILDRHILGNLVRLGVIDVVPKSLTRNRYLDIEAKMRDFCRMVGIPMGHMDLLLWARQTGFVFK